MNNPNYNKDDDSIIIDTSSLSNNKIRRSRDSILCVNCHIKLEEVSENNFHCKTCHCNYFLGYEIMEFEDDDFSVSHDYNPTVELEGVSGINKPLLLCLHDEENESSFDDEYSAKKKSGFYSMDYIKRPGIIIREYHEEIPDNNNS